MQMRYAVIAILLAATPAFADADNRTIIDGRCGDPTIGLLPTPADGWANWQTAGLQAIPLSGYIAGTTLTVTTSHSNALGPGQAISLNPVAGGTAIRACASHIAFAGPIELSGGEKDMSKGMVFCCKDDGASDEGQPFIWTDADRYKAQIEALIELRKRLNAANIPGVILFNGVDVREALRIELDAILDLDRRLKLLETPVSGSPR